MPATASKATLRTAALAARDALSDEQRAAAAQAVAERGLPFAIGPETIVSGYAPIRSEIDPTPLMRTIAAQGARLALPTVMARGQALTFRSWSPNDRMVLGPLGIPEPSPAAPEVIPDVMLVPLAAFDRLGHRIGYGAGHYDYTFAHLRKIKAVRGVGRCLCRAANQGGPGVGARRGAGLCANGNTNVRFPELMICVFFSLATWSAGPGAPRSRNTCPA